MSNSSPVSEALLRCVARTTRLNAEVSLLCNAALRGAQEIDRLRETLLEIQRLAELQREPHWSYRNTITTNKHRIKELCAAALEDEPIANSEVSHEQPRNLRRP